MPASILDITLEDNSDFELKLQLLTDACSVIDIASYGMIMQIRDAKVDGNVLIEATLGNGYINVNSTTDIFEIDIPVSVITPQIQNFEDIKNRAYYDCVIFPDSAAPTTDPIRLVEGRVEFSRGITKLV